MEPAELGGADRGTRVVAVIAAATLIPWALAMLLMVGPRTRRAGPGMTIVGPLPAALLALFDPTTHPVPFYAGVLWVLSVNRFYLATAVAVVPRLVPTEDLLMANSMSVVGGTVWRRRTAGAPPPALDETVPIVSICLKTDCCRSRAR